MTNLLRSLSVSACVVLTTATLAKATADGPDHLRVSGIAKESVLNMRSAPSTDAPVVGRTPSGTDGLLSFGCVGVLSQSEWQTATNDERAAAKKSRWCLVGHNRTIAWSAGWFLSEGSEPDTMNAGDRLTDLAGSEWLLRDLAGEPAQAEAWIRFEQDGTALGNSGCNRFNGSYEAPPDRLSFGPIAMTRRACLGPESDTEFAFMRALEKTHSIAATHLVLSLFDEENALLATLTRRDAE